VTIDHGPISELGWPSMVMAFKAPSGINIMSVKVGEPVRFAFRETATGYELSKIEPMPEESEKGDEQ
ncbi:MAG: copper-binding protein, partial [Amphiplicatus sp.]